jgi:hypothetical protein
MKKMPGVLCSSDISHSQKLQATGVFYGKEGFVIFRGDTTRNHYRPELSKPVSALMEILFRINLHLGFASLYLEHRGPQATADHVLLTLVGRIHSLSTYSVPPEMRFDVQL